MPARPQALYSEFVGATPPERDALDAKLFFERRLADLFSHRQRWFGRGRGPFLTVEVRDFLKLSSFWLAVWGLKVITARLILLPVLLESHASLVHALPLSSFLDNELYGYTTDGYTTGWQLAIRLQPLMLLRAALQVLLWGTGGAIYLADTLGWYQLVLAFWGGFSGIWRRGVPSVLARHQFDATFYEKLQRHACAKLLLSLASSNEEVAALKMAALKSGKATAIPQQYAPHGTHCRASVASGG
jgi:hypothetical protein